MPTYSMTMPNGRTYSMPGPAGLTEADVYAHIMQNDPAAATAPPPPKTGVMATLQGAAENFGSSSLAGIKGAFGNAQTAAEEAAAAEKDQAKRFDSQTGLGRVADAYNAPTGGLWAAAKEVGAQFPRMLAQSAPQMGAALAGGAAGARLGAAVAGPVGAAVGGIGGGLLANLPSFTGQNLAQQQETHPGEVSYGKALAAGAGQAALEEAAPMLFMGKRVAGKLFGDDIAQLIGKLGPEAAEKVAARRLSATVARGGLTGVLGEGGTEVAQEVLSRWQAGQNLLDNDALKSYAENFYGGALVGGPLGGAGHAYDRAGAQKEVAAKEQAAQAEQAQKAAAAQAAAEAQAAQDEEARRANPAFVDQVEAEHDAFEAKRKDIMARRLAAKKSGTAAGALEHKLLGEELGTLVKDNEQLMKDYIATGPARAERDAAAATAAEAEAAAYNVDPMGPQPGTPEAIKAARIEELQQQIAEHEEAIPTAAATVRKLIQGGSSADLSAADEALNQRKAGLKSAWRELNRLDPTIAAQRTQQQEAQAAAAAREADLESFDPAKARQELVELTAARQKLSLKEGNVAKAGPIIARMEELQSLLDEHGQQQELGAAREVWGRDLPPQRAEPKPQGQLALPAPVRPLALPAPSAESRAADTEAAFNRAFAPNQRSGVLDTAAQAAEDIGLAGSEGDAIVSRLNGLQQEDREELAPQLQAHAAEIKQAIRSGITKARAAGDEVRLRQFLDAHHSISAMEQMTDAIGPGRAHYRPDFYRITAPLVPNVVQGARQILGMSAPKPGHGTSGRGEALHKRTTEREGARLQGVDDPRLTAAMLDAAIEDMDETVGLPQQEPGRRVPKGTMQERETLPEDESGQQYLFRPAAAEVAPTPAAAMRQRVDTLLAMPRLTEQARKRLQAAADVLGGTSDTRVVPPHVLASIGNTVEQAEKGAGRDMGAPQRTGLRTQEGTAVSVKDGQLQLEGKGQRPTLTAARKEPSGATREVQGAAAYIGTGGKEEGDTVQQGAAAEVRKDRTQGPGKTQAQETGRKDMLAAARARAEADLPEAVQKARAASPASDSPVLPTELEMDELGEAGQKDTTQDSLFPEGSAEAFRQVIARAMKRIAALKKGNTGLREQAADLQKRIAVSAAAQERLQRVSAAVRSADPRDRAAVVEPLRQELLKATDATHKAAKLVAGNVRLAEEAAAAGDGKRQRRHMRNANRVAAEFMRQKDRVDDLRRRLQVHNDADAAPALEAAAEHHDILVSDLANIESAIAKNAAALKTQEKNVRRATTRAAAVKAPERGGLYTNTALDEAAAPLLKREADKRRAADQAERDRPYEPSEEQRRTTAINRSEAVGKRYVAKEQPLESVAKSVEDAAETAMETPGVTRAAIAAQVRAVDAYKNTARAFESMAGKVYTQLSKIKTQMDALRMENRGGVLPEAIRDRYAKAVATRAKQEAKIKAAKSADARDAATQEMLLTDKRIRAFDAQRVPLEKDTQYRDLRKRAALLVFKSEAIDARAAQLTLQDETPSKTALDVLAKAAEVGVKNREEAKKAMAAAREAVASANEAAAEARDAALKAMQAVDKPTPQPGTPVGPDKPVTRMGEAKQKKSQKTVYQSQGASPTEEMTKAADTRKAIGLATNAALAEARKQGPLTPAQSKAIAERIAAAHETVPQTAADRSAEAKRAIVERPLTQAEKRTEQTERRAAAAQERAQAQQAEEDAAAMAAMANEGGRAFPHGQSSAPVRHTFLNTTGTDAVHAGNLGAALDSLAAKGSSPIVRAMAANLRKLIGDTTLSVEKDLHVDGKPANGSYDPETNHIAIDPRYITEETLVHEVGHAATVHMLEAPDSSLTREQRNARNALVSMLEKLKKDPKFEGEYGQKDVHELASEVISNQKLRDKIDAQKPGFIRRFINAVLQAFGIQPQSLSAKAMAHVEQMFQPARKMTAAEIAARKQAGGTATMAHAPAATPALDHFAGSLSGKTHPGGIKAAWKDPNKGLAFEYAVSDQRAPILKAVAQGSTDTYDQAHYLLRKADSRMSQVQAVLANGPLQIKRDAKGFRHIESGNGPSATKVIDAISRLPGAKPEAKYAKAQAYMVAQRAANKGWDKLGFETSAQMRAAGEAMWKEVNANPALKAQLEAVRKVYNEYNKGQIEFLVETGTIPKKLGQELLADGDYVPFYRVHGSGPSATAELVLGEGKSIKLGDIRRQPYLQQLKGDTTANLMPLQDAITRNTMILTNMALENVAKKEIAYALQGMSGYTDENNKQKNHNPIHSLKAGEQAPAGADVITFNQEPDPKVAADTGKRWMRIKSDGTPFAGIPAELLVQSLEGTHVVMTGLGKIGSAIGDLLRKGVTRNPMYLWRQLTRDPSAAAFTAGLERGPITATLKSMQEFMQQSTGGTATGDALLRKGVTQSGIFTGDAHDLGKIALQIAGGNQSLRKQLLAGLDRAAMRADSATRAQVYEDTLKKTGSEMKAELAAMEVLNHSKRGGSPSVQKATRMIPFMSSQIQALNVLIKAASGNATLEEKMRIKAKFIQRAIGMSIMSTVYAMGMEDDDEYQKASAQDRTNNYFVPTPWGTMKLPIPYEPGLLFKALPEAAVRGLSGHFDATDWKALRGAMLNSIPGMGNLLFMPQAVGGLAEVAANKRFRDMSDITPQSQAHLDPSEQVRSNSTALTEGIAAAIRHVPGLSKINERDVAHLVSSYLGSVPLAAAAIADSVLSDKVKPDGDLSQLPVFGGAFLKENGTGKVDSAYAALEKVTAVQATIQKKIDNKDTEGLSEYRAEHKEELAQVAAAQTFKTAMTNLRKREQAVRNSKLASDAMQAQINEIARAKDMVASRFIGR